MKLENYEVHLPSYSIGDHIYDKIGPVCESYGKTVLLIGGRRALKAAEEKIRAQAGEFSGQTDRLHPALQIRMPSLLHVLCG